MAGDAKLIQGTAAWFNMVGTLMREAATRSGLSPEINVSFVERYIDGCEIAKDLVQGIRFDIVDGIASFRIGAERNERGDVTVEITAPAARALNALYSADPNYRAAREKFLSSGEMRVDGDASRLGDWLAAVHDPIVDRTA